MVFFLHNEKCLIFVFFFKLIDACIHFCHVSSLFCKYVTFFDLGSSLHHPPFLKKAKWAISPLISSEMQICFLP